MKTLKISLSGTTWHRSLIFGMKHDQVDLYSVVEELLLFDCLDMTIAVDWDVKPQTKHKKHGLRMACV